MIKETELREAIAECQGDRNPNANTCIKLAAYYTILNQMYPNEMPTYSYAEPPREVMFNSGSEFSEMILGKNMDDVLMVIDELMDTVQVLVPKLYRATLEKIKEL